MATQIPKLITNVEPYFRYEGEANATTQDQFQGFLKNEHSVLAVLTKGIWQPTTAYEIGDIIKSPNMPKGFHAIAQTKGNSGANEPTWGTGTTNVSDGTVSWKLSKGDITVNGVGADSNGNIQINNIANATHANKADLATKATNADNATKATQDSAGQTISSTYIKDVSGVDGAIKVTKGNGISNTISIAPKYPSWYTDRGDGSDGDFIPNENTTISGVKNYKRVFIKNGITVNVSRYVRIKCQDSFVNLGLISANGQGAAGGDGGSIGDSSNNYHAGSGYGGSVLGSSISSGGAGGNGKAKGGAGGGRNYIAMDMSYFDVMYGSGGGGGGGGHGANSGAGGAGGGDIVIVASSVENKGTVSANGANGANGGDGIIGGGGGGGGGGGRVIIVANVIEQGTVTVKGGAGGAGGSDSGSGATGGAGLKFIKQLGVI